ncbi:HECT-domain-containing protein [Russula compacta]|nr:HECT-domain-containing protein [Russula compacta]
MLPFAQEKRRKINLGGATSVSSQTDLLHNAKARRTEREEIRRRHESAILIQTCWRSSQQSRVVKHILKEMFQEDILGLNGMRALLLIGHNDSLLAQWSERVVHAGDAWFLHYVRGPDLDRWIVLIRKMAVLLLFSLANSPRIGCRLRRSANQHLRLSSSTWVVSFTSESSGGNCASTSGLFPANELLIDAHILTFGSSHPESFSEAYTSLFQHILTLPLLPNRIPLTSLSHFSANLPLSAASVLSPSISRLASVLGIAAKVHLLANMATFVPPRYTTLPSASLTTLLHLSAAVMSTLPSGVLEPKSSVAAGKQGAELESDSDSEDDTHIPASPATRIPRLDERTSKRLQTLPAPTHISSLIRATQNNSTSRLAFCDFLFALCSALPLRIDSVLSTIVVSTGGGFVRELYRVYVRSSPLGKEVSLATLLDTANADAWLPLLFLTDLYTHSLLTMGDDEFFSSFGTPARANAPRNPLTLDEITSLSRKLLNIAFTLFWREGQIGAQNGRVPGLNIKWEAVRRKVTRFLQAVHARDSRRPFTPSDHWLVNEHIDIRSFIEAAIVEEQQFVQPVGARPLTRRSIADLSPRLGVLNNIPFAIPFEARVKIFSGPSLVRWVHLRTRITVRRGHIAEDGFDKLGDANLKHPIVISFIDQFGEKEMGIDGGGVFKEFFTDLSKEVFDSNRGLWLVNKKNELYPNHGSYATQPHSLNWYRFIGRILGKALYEGILVDVAFAGFFLSKWLGKQSFLDDLASLDPDLYQGLMFLKHYTGNPEELSLNFTIVDEEFGVTRTIDLKPNGSNVPVSQENKLEYILRVSHYRLTRQIKEQSDAFFEGLSEIIDAKWLRMFNQQELQVLLGGVNTPIDINDLRRNTNYGGLYDDKEPTIVAFWKVVEGFDTEQRRALLRFVTSVGRPPLLGFSGLVPMFCIRDAGGDENRLPTSSTCVNLLKLPRYQSEGVLRQKLLQALYSGAGFDLS